MLFALKVIIAITSFARAAHVCSHDASFAYYMLPTRMGELMVGALIGLPAALNSWRLDTCLSYMLDWAGVLRVALSLCIIDSHDPFPRWFAIPPTMGAALIFLAGESGQRPWSA